MEARDPGCGRTRTGSGTYRVVSGSEQRGVHTLQAAPVSHGVFTVRERRVSQVGELSSLTNHLVVTTLLLGGHGKLVPQVHPVTVLAVDALTTNFNLNVVNHVDTRVVDPAGKSGVARRTLF